MAMTQLADHVAGPLAISEVSVRLREQLVKQLGYAQQQNLAGAVGISRCGADVTPPDLRRAKVRRCRA